MTYKTYNMISIFFSSDSFVSSPPKPQFSFQDEIEVKKKFNNLQNLQNDIHIVFVKFFFLLSPLSSPDSTTFI